MASIKTSPVWQLLLAIYLILVCIAAFIGLGGFAIIIPILAGIAGVLCLLGM